MRRLYPARPSVANNRPTEQPPNYSASPDFFVGPIGLFGNLEIGKMLKTFLAAVLLSASVERFGVSRMRDFFTWCWFQAVNHYVCHPRMSRNVSASQGPMLSVEIDGTARYTGFLQNSTSFFGFLWPSQKKPLYENLNFKFLVSKKKNP